MVAQAVSCFLSQTWAEKELVILDDADDPSFPNPPEHPQIRYFRTDIHYWLSIPQKRNAVNGLANGEIIWHLDSDDWSSPTRMEDQVRRLEETGKAVTGYHSMDFFDEAAGKVYEYRSGPYYALGSSLCYQRSFWQDNPFDENYRHGSDTVFVRVARLRGQLDAVDSEGRMVARLHSGNSHGKGFPSVHFQDRTVDQFPSWFQALVSA